MTVQFILIYSSSTKSRRAVTADTDLRLCRFLGERRVRCLSSYGDGFRRDGTGITQPIVRGVVKLVSILSFERLTAEYSDLLYIAVKEPYGSLCVGR